MSDSIKISRRNLVDHPSHRDIDTSPRKHVPITMQNLWPRVAQTKCTCRCPSCVFTKAAVARRATTTGRDRFIKPILQSATFTYSAIFAGAVAIDGGIKQDKRQKLDKAIAKAKLRLEQDVPDEIRELGFDSQADRLVPPDLAINKDPEVMSPSIGSVVQTDGRAEEDKPRIDKRSTTEILDGISWLETLHYDVAGDRRPAWPRNLGPKVDAAKLPPQSLWATPNAAEAAASRLWTSRKLRHLELAVGHFVLETLLEHGLYADGPLSLEQIPSSLQAWTALSSYQMTGTANSLDQAMWEVRNAKRENWEAVYRRQTGFIPQLKRGMPNYEQDAEGLFRHTQWSLNNSLYKTFDNAMETVQGPVGTPLETGTYRDLAIKICHDLLCSSAPPTHRTINLLLVGFTKINAPRSAEQIIRLMSFAHIRPNERTCVAVLNHYTLTENAEGFTHFVEKIRGGHGGVALANPVLTIDAENSTRIIEKPDTKLRKLVQKVHPTPLVLNAIIAGLLRFTGFDNALRLVANLQVDGWGLDKSGLELFLRDCVRAADWSNGVKVWRQMKQLSRNDHLDDSHYAVMLRLCLECKKESDFREIYSDAVSNMIDTSQLYNLMMGPGSDAQGSSARSAARLAHHVQKLGKAPLLRYQRTGQVASSTSSSPRLLKHQRSNISIETDDTPSSVSNIDNEQNGVEEAGAVLLDSESQLRQHDNQYEAVIEVVDDFDVSRSRSTGQPPSTSFRGLHIP